MAPSFKARLPSRGTTTTSNTNTIPLDPDPNLPTTQDLLGTWHMAASSSSFWHDKHSISVTYSTPSNPGAPAGTFEDTTTWYSTTSSKQTITRGICTPSPSEPGGYEWRGAGWLLRMISTKWEVVGWGVLPPIPDDGREDGDEEPMLVALAQKTLFSPQGLSIYVRRKGGLSEGKVRAVAEAVAAFGDEDLRGEAGRLMAVPVPEEGGK